MNTQLKETINEAYNFDIWLKDKVKSIYYADKSKMDRAFNIILEGREVKESESLQNCEGVKEIEGEGCNFTTVKKLINHLKKPTSTTNKNIINKMKKFFAKHLHI